MSLVGSNGHIIFYFQIINKSKNRKVCFRYWPLLFDISFSFVVLVLCSYFSSINGTSNILIFSLIFFFFFLSKTSETISLCISFLVQLNNGSAM